MSSATDTAGFEEEASTGVYPKRAVYRAEEAQLWHTASNSLVYLEVSAVALLCLLALEVENFHILVAAGLEASVQALLPEVCPDALTADYRGLERRGSRCTKPPYTGYLARVPISPMLRF